VSDKTDIQNVQSSGSQGLELRNAMVHEDYVIQHCNSILNIYCTMDHHNCSDIKTLQ